MTLILSSDKLATRSLGNIYGVTGPADYALMLDFDNGVYRAGLDPDNRRNLSLNEAIQYARADSATVRNRDGSRTIVGPNTPRISYWPSVGRAGLLVENTRNNYFRNSESPATQTITLPAGGSYVLWVEGSGSATITGDVAASKTASAGSPVEVTVSTPFSVTVTVTGSLARVQLENAVNGPFPTSYIPTTSAAVTRIRDSVALAPAAFSELVLASQGTILVEAVHPQPATGASAVYGSQHVIRLGKSSGSGSVGIEAKYGITQLQGVVNDNAGTLVATARINGGLPAAPVRMGVGYSSSGVSLARGGEVVPQAAATFPTGMDRLDLGQSPAATGLSLNGIITRMTYYRRRLTDAELAAATA